ncbi:P-loop containing nucleoside triphosphate hydrolase protein [Sphaerosporella brunnea]|uniref:P-loop containing nucleoside triphosphate hydrolase protein n=1 Tax=Sphaerosporella brunnea TaxID=1250544 RepID=A0A5J5F3I2_9PEZI|nr:P-loop containing nucleoside triphosphate hydrolase protein [Sphaerosporella brunnea]
MSSVLDARITLVGFPSVGNSTLLSKITKTKPAVASYAFTTLTAIPGVMEYGGAEIQSLDLPGIIEGASEGKGQVISGAKTSDLIVMVLDAAKKAEQRALIFIPPSPPSDRGFAAFCGDGFRPPPAPSPATLCRRRRTWTKMIYNILRDYKLLNCEVLVRDENCTVDNLTDVIMAPHRKYMKCLYVYNKIDCISLSYFNTLVREPRTVVMSGELDIGIGAIVAPGRSLIFSGYTQRGREWHRISRRPSLSARMLPSSGTKSSRGE